MLFKKRKEMALASEKFRKQLQERLTKLSSSQAAEEKQLAGMQENLASLSGGIDTIQEELRRARGEISRQNMALEDVLETLSSMEEEEENTRKQKRAVEEEKDKLLDLVFLYQQMMWNMRTYASQYDPGILKQLNIWDNALREKMLGCKYIPIGSVGETVNYELHEILKTVDTTDQSRDRKVACVYRPGYMYMGTLYQKAQVAAYRLIANAETGE